MKVLIDLSDYQTPSSAGGLTDFCVFPSEEEKNKSVTAGVAVATAKAHAVKNWADEISSAGKKTSIANLLIGDDCAVMSSADRGLVAESVGRVLEALKRRSNRVAKGRVKRGTVEERLRVAEAALLELLKY
jgi:hypothetical protein